jgi:anti-sigma factor RsiW
LVLRYLDGQTTPTEVQQLSQALRASPECRDRFVQMSRLHGELSEVLAPTRVAASRRRKVRRARPGTASADAAAATPAAVSVLTGDDAVPTPAVPAGEPSTPGADTLLGKVSAEDTVHGPPSPPAEPKNDPAS